MKFEQFLAMRENTSVPANWGQEQQPDDPSNQFSGLRISPKQALEYARDRLLSCTDARSLKRFNNPEDNAYLEQTVIHLNNLMKSMT